MPATSLLEQEVTKLVNANMQSAYDILAPNNKQLTGQLLTAAADTERFDECRRLLEKLAKKVTNPQQPDGVVQAGEKAITSLAYVAALVSGTLEVIQDADLDLQKPAGVSTKDFAQIVASLAKEAAARKLVTFHGLRAAQQVGAKNEICI